MRPLVLSMMVLTALNTKVMVVLEVPEDVEVAELL